MCVCVGSPEVRGHEILTVTHSSFVLLVISINGDRKYKAGIGWGSKIMTLGLTMQM